MFPRVNFLRFVVICHYPYLNQTFVKCNPYSCLVFISIATAIDIRSAPVFFRSQNLQKVTGTSKLVVVWTVDCCTTETLLTTEMLHASASVKTLTTLKVFFVHRIFLAVVKITFLETTKKVGLVSRNKHNFCCYSYRSYL